MAIGNFDGLHLGHKAVIARAISLAEQFNTPASVMSFEPHPRRFFNPALPPLRLIALRDKVELLRHWGVDMLRLVRFTSSFSYWTAEQFVERLLVESLKVRHIVIGYDFVFGKERSGDAKLLQLLGEKHGFGVTVCEQVQVAKERCSSSAIRDYLAKGNIEEASKILGRPYALCGKVRHGNGRGNAIGFATANLVFPHLFLPAHGVYAVRAHVRGAVYDGVANLGSRPTFDGQEVRLETHLFGWSAPLYGDYLRVELVGRIRKERKFANVSALTAQIAEDVQAAKEMLLHRGVS